MQLSQDFYLCKKFSIFNTSSAEEDSVSYCYPPNLQLDSIMHVLDDSTWCFISETPTFNNFCNSLKNNDYSHVFTDKVHLIAALCQGIPYVDDRKKFNKEVFYAPEYLLKVGEGDCEDKAVLCARLISAILGHETILIKYEGKNHMNIGIQLPDSITVHSEEVEPDFMTTQYSYLGKRYTVLEPSSLSYELGEQPESLQDVPISKIRFIRIHKCK